MLFHAFGRVGWRLWLASTSALFLVAGLLSLVEAGVTAEGFTPDHWWFALAWLPAGTVGLILAAINHPPQMEALYSGIPALFALGSFGRAAGLFVADAWVGAVGWSLVTWLIAWGWSRAMAPPVAVE